MNVPKPTTLLGGLAHCPCGSTVMGARSNRGRPIYRCNPRTRVSTFTGGHVARAVESVDLAVAALIAVCLERNNMGAEADTMELWDGISLMKKREIVKIVITNRAHLTVVP